MTPAAMMKTIDSNSNGVDDKHDHNFVSDGDVNEDALKDDSNSNEDVGISNTNNVGTR